MLCPLFWRQALLILAMPFPCCTVDQNQLPIRVAGHHAVLQTVEQGAGELLLMPQVRFYVLTLGELFQHAMVKKLISVGHDVSGCCCQQGPKGDGARMRLPERDGRERKLIDDLEHCHEEGATKQRQNRWGEQGRIHLGNGDMRWRRRVHLEFSYVSMMFNDASLDVDVVLND